MPRKLLVADDSLTIQKVIRLALSGAAAGSGDGYEIQAVSDGNDAVQQISLFRPDVVLIDVSLPGKSAFEVKRVTNQHRDLETVRFVLMSSAFEKVDEQQVGEVDFHGRLTKPFDPAHLREVLNEVLRHAAPAPPPAPPHAPPQPPQREPQSFPQGPPPLPVVPPSLPDDAQTSRHDESSPSLEFSGRNEPSGLMDFPRFNESESDIRNLTESTIRMSGLASSTSPHPPRDMPPIPESSSEDFQWSMQEYSLKPPSSLDSGDSTFPLAPPPPKPPDERSRYILQPTQAELDETSLPRQFPGQEGHASRSSDRVPGFPSNLGLDGMATGPLEMPPLPTYDEADKDEERPGHDSEVRAARFDTHDEPQHGGLDSAKIEKELERKMAAMISHEVEKAIRRLAQESLPEVAERLIKEEIHRLLSEAP